MEDTTLVTHIFNNGRLDTIFAIFDGHGGNEVSIFSKVVFPIILEHNLNLKNQD